MLSTISRHAPRLAVLVLGLVLFAGLAPTAAIAAEPFTMDVYFRAGYERQVDGRTCTAASAAMMLNFIAGKDLRLSQLGILRYAQPRDALNNAKQRGSDPLGWAKALTHFSTRAGHGKFSYEWKSYPSEYTALMHAARLIAYTGKPVGLLIKHGRHAVVMTGFKASGDPREGDFKLTDVWISDPYGSRHRRYPVARSPLDKYLELDATKKYDRAWYGRYIIVAPKAQIAKTGSTASAFISGLESRPSAPIGD
jgi:hypothetical protein